MTSMVYKNIAGENERNSFVLHLFWLYSSDQISEKQFLNGITRIKHNLIEEYDSVMPYGTV